MSAAAFQPCTSQDYRNYGYRIHTIDEDWGFYAPVQLPHGATITKMTFYWWTQLGSSGKLSLYRNQLNNYYDLMGFAVTGSGIGSSTDSSISYATIDNSQYAYYFEFEPDDTFCNCYGATIEYTFTEPY